MALLLLAPVAAVLLAVETEPRVGGAEPPQATTAALTRDLAEALQTLIATDAAAGRWTVTEPEIDAALTAARRVLPELRGNARLGREGILLDVSVGPPTLPAGLWLNAHVTVAPSSDGIRVAAARIGRLPIPAGAIVPAARLAGDRLLGDGLATLALDAVAGVAVDPPEATLAFTADPARRAALFGRIRDGVRSVTGADDSEPVHVHLWYLSRADDLPDRGSMLPYLRFVVAKAAELSGRGPGGEQIRAGLVALALHCGDGALGPVVGVRARDESRNRCAGTTLAGRDDLKRHFVISAGIEAARSGQAALGMGELKELLDSNAGGSGFSFDDMTANLAGMRFAQTFLAAPRGEWPAMLSAIDDEADVLPSLAGLPTGLGEAEFRARYGSVDSPEYSALLAEIERRIAALPLYRNPPSN